MADDIVTRLREGYGQGCKCFAHCEHECGCDAIWAGRYTNEAADEIERLRAELKDADDDFHALKTMFDKMRAEVRGE